MTTHPDSFGQNQWLVDEMYRKFRDNPHSVDDAWRAYFTDQKLIPSPAASPSTDSGQVVSEPFGPTNPTAFLTDYNYSETAADPVHVQRASTERVRSAAKDALTTMYTVETMTGPNYPELTEEEKTSLRGTARAIARNMNASRDIPMATSVRSIPVKLMFENRALINS